MLVASDTLGSAVTPDSGSGVPRPGATGNRRTISARAAKPALHSGNPREPALAALRRRAPVIGGAQPVEDVPGSALALGWGLQVEVELRFRAHPQPQDHGP